MKDVQPQAQILAFPSRPGQKRIRRKKCPDEYLDLPPPPKLWEADPAMLGEIEKAGEQLAAALERYRDKMPSLWFWYVDTPFTASFCEIAIRAENNVLVEKFKEQEMKVRTGLKLLNRNRGSHGK